MIRAVFFDMLDTLVYFYPEQGELLASVCREFGINITPQGARRGFKAAGAFWVRETNRLPLEERSPSQKEALYKEYDLLALREAGVQGLSKDTAYRIVNRLMKLNQEGRWVLFDDVLPTLESLKRKGLTLGVVSNIGTYVKDMCRELGLGGLIDVTVSSYEVGVEKPHPAIFLAAAKETKVSPEEALYVGDQYENDVLGALGAGMKPILLDRYGLYPEAVQCTRIQTLKELKKHLNLLNSEEGSSGF